MSSDRFELPDTKRLEVVVSSLEGVEKKSGKLINLRVNLKTRDREIYSIIVNPERKDFFVGDRYKAVLKVYIPPDFLGDNPKTMKIGTCCYRVDSLTDKKGRVIYKKQED
jgi:hypothetical protein